MDPLRINDLTLSVKGSKVQDSIPYISNTLFRRGFTKFTMDVGVDEDDNTKLTVDVWKDVSESELIDLVKILSIGARNKCIGNVNISYTVQFYAYCKCPVHTITGSNEDEIRTEIQNALHNP